MHKNNADLQPPNADLQPPNVDLQSPKRCPLTSPPECNVVNLLIRRVCEELSFHAFILRIALSLKQERCSSSLVCSAVNVVQRNVNNLIQFCANRFCKLHSNFEFSFALQNP